MVTQPAVRIRTIAVDHGPERSRRLVRRRSGWLLRRLAGRRQPPRVCGDLYWPVDLAVAAAMIELPFRAARSARVALARDAVTGRLGVVDVALREREETSAAPGELVAAVAAADDEAWLEFARDQVVRRYRPSGLVGLELCERERVYVPYHVVAEGDSTFLVDRLMHRVEPARSLRGEAEETVASGGGGAHAPPER
ncbi:hypothetical protein [Allosalinactinospora lopnorensis]|uniref:hypothetical protein n=1 Tax=Allosalinactinospora lopnorensis TaxID=1352348 RepID=UPI000623F73B|nr:hypothetical protein [Allosalinactinospora lopnorensis]